MIMRLTEKNIKFVKRLERNDKTYEYFVSMKSNRVSDSRLFNVVSKEELPKAVQNFMNKRTEELFEIPDEDFAVYIYRA